MNSKINTAISFLEVAENLNFAIAAAKLKMTPSTLSRNIKELETSLGTLLFNRTTRQVSLTEAGFKYYEFCKKGLKEFEKAELEVALLNSSPHGTLKIMAPICFGQLCIAPYLTDYMHKYPQINIELNFYDVYTLNFEKEVDLIFKIGNLPDSRLKTKSLFTCDYAIVSSHKYTKTNGIPSTPDQLINHNCLTPGSSLLNNTWKLTKAGNTRKFKVQGKLQSNSALLINEAVLNGNGIAALPSYITTNHIKSGEVVELLSDWHIPKNNIYLMYVETNKLAPKIKTFIEYISSIFTPHPPWRNTSKQSIYT